VKGWLGADNDCSLWKDGIVFQKVRTWEDSWIDTTPSLTLRYGPIGALARRVSPPRFTSIANERHGFMNPGSSSMTTSILRTRTTLNAGNLQQIPQENLLRGPSLFSICRYEKM
jgi:hypothetical protein